MRRFSFSVLVSFWVLSGGGLFAASPKYLPGPTLVQSVPLESAYNEPTIPVTADVWLDLIRNAKWSIDLEQMYVASEPGQAFEPILVELEAAAKRGVKIRLMLATKMLGNDKVTLERVKKIPGLEFRSIDIRTGIQHAKFWIVDGEVSFVGSQNLDWRSLDHVQELGVLVSNTVIAKKLGAIFEKDWALAAAQAAAANPTASSLPVVATSAEISVESLVDPAIEIVASPESLNPKGIRSARVALRELLDSAQRSISIQVMDYAVRTRFDKSDWREVDDGLRAAAARGVQIKLTVSHWNAFDKVELESLKDLAKVPNIEVRMITVPQHSSGVIPYARVVHSKTMVVDDEVLWVGTSNWTKNYFMGSRNVELIIRNAGLAKQCELLLTRLRNGPKMEVVDDSTSVRPKW